MIDAFELAERGWLPDGLIRFGIRRMLSERLRGLDAGDPERQAEREARFLETLRASPIAESTADANRQHYEVPADFFRIVLGPRLKYSCCYWPSGVDSLPAAEVAMLELTCARGELADGMRILELGCGWGSLTLWMAERFPHSEITAVSNSSGQRASIEADCARRGLRNVTVVTADMNDYRAEQTYDRVVSIEMFEHMRNYERLMERIATWLTPGGKLFVHLFCHRTHAYLYEPSGPNDWMAREFFTGGTMPSDTLLLRFPQAMQIERQWRVGGLHYQRTLEAWLRRLDDNRLQAEQALRAADDARDPTRQAQRWRLFLMGCAELFAFGGGREWYVSHYLFKRREPAIAGL
jgi:cyclopropane-fatty-acyl-phospholipid synthase